MYYICIVLICIQCIYTYIDVYEYIYIYIYLYIILLTAVFERFAANCLSIATKPLFSDLRHIWARIEAIWTVT